jgi:hypothetical protein
VFTPMEGRAMKEYVVLPEYGRRIRRPDSAPLMGPKGV